MKNDEIIQLFSVAASLMELHEENAFKIRGYQNAAFGLEKVTEDLCLMDLNKLESLDGIGKGMAAKIHEINTTGMFRELAELMEKTPAGVIDLLSVKGIGPKKVRTLWKEMNITSKEDLLQACLDNKVAGIKGFGSKTQENIRAVLEYSAAQKDKFMYAEVEATALKLEEIIKSTTSAEQTSLAGEIRRRMETVETILLIVASHDPVRIQEELNGLSVLEQHLQSSSPFIWRGRETMTGCKVEIKVYPPEVFGSQLLIHSCGIKHLSSIVKDSLNVYQFAILNKNTSEKEIYQLAGCQYIEPEMREGFDEIALAKENKLPELITYTDLKGVLHNHSTYSDGSHTLEQMALHCKKLGFEYLGISDHSKSAFYANGLYENRILEQHKEIDELNQKLAPFKIFKGIESDILNDGSLDYDEQVLASFDFIVASIHSNLKMAEDKATERLIKAIENPYTTILGHATGRLLLKREGYPINHQKVIDACAANQVVIEINANPRRLDMEWKWVRYALEKEVMISINPDAHAMEGYNDMYYGLLVGRKAGLTRKSNLNSLSLSEIDDFFKAKKAGKLVRFNMLQE